LLLRPAALCHIVLNLLDNAVKYGPTGQTIHVRVRGVDGDVRVEVEDEGTGIATADREKLWRPYARGRTAGHTAGSGLGLSIVRDVVALHGGRAWIADANGHSGALFVIVLPAVKEQQTQTAIDAAIPITTDPVMS
jgi:signal transduction histidine kinase